MQPFVRWSLTVVVENAVYNRVAEIASPLSQGVSFRIISAICELVLLAVHRAAAQASRNNSSYSTSSTAEDGLAAIDDVLSTSIVSAIFTVLRKTQPSRPPTMGCTWARSYRFDQMLKVLSMCFHVCPSCRATVYRSLSCLLPLHPSIAQPFHQWCVKADSTEDGYGIDFCSVAVTQIEVLIETVNSSVTKILLKDAELNTLIASIRLLISVARNGSAGKFSLCERLNLGVMQDFVQYLCTLITSCANYSASSSPKQGAAEGSPRSPKLPVKIIILCAIALECTIELLVELYATLGAVIYPCFCCFAEEQAEKKLVSCGSCYQTRALINIADKVSHTIHNYLLQRYGEESESVVIDSLCRILDRLGRHFDLCQSKPIVSQLCQLVFRSPGKFDLNLCSLVDALTVYCGYRSQTTKDSVYHIKEQEDDDVFNPSSKSYHFYSIRRLLLSQLQRQENGVAVLDPALKTNLLRLCGCVYPDSSPPVATANKGKQREPKGVAVDERTAESSAVSGEDSRDNHRDGSSSSTSSSNDEETGAEITVRVVKKSAGTVVPSGTSVGTHAESAKERQITSLASLLPFLRFVPTSLPAFKSHFYSR
jgi:hypothetical protein